jgi:ribosomal protein S18 acetylase RimI-like enzyme
MQPVNQLYALDKYNNPIIIEWYTTSIISSQFAASMSSIWNIAREAYLPVEMQFLRAFPDVVFQEKYFESFKPLFEEGIHKVNWSTAETKMEAMLQSHFVFDPASFSDAMKTMFADDVCFFAVSKDIKGAIVGFVTFIVRSNYAVGDVKVMSLGVVPSHQNCGLGKLLMSSIFNIMPTVKRIFLCTRVTNEIALRAYANWGFAKDIDPVMDHPFNSLHWTFLEYKIERSDILQKVATELIVH